MIEADRKFWICNVGVNSVFRWYMFEIFQYLEIEKNTDINKELKV